jgi:hypothetical protein
MRDPGLARGWHPDEGEASCVAEHPLDQRLDATAAFLLPEQARLDDARVVEHQQVAGAQKVGQRGEAPIGKLAGRAVDMQQPAAAALRQRITGDQFIRQKVVEVSGFHGEKPVGAAL